VDPDPYTRARGEMVDLAIAGRGFTDRRVLDVMRYVPRHEFVEPAERAHAYEDRPLPIGFGSTISQPYVVAIMTSAVAVRPGDRALEIGTGSGYQAALLAELGAKVYTIELDGALAHRTRQTLTDLGLTDIEVETGDGYFGWPAAAPFDEIVVTTAPPAPPPPLVAQLKIGGRMVIPVGEDQQVLRVLTREPDGLNERDLIDVRFSPMLGDGVRAQLTP
jgi:protein-L-isoaspartate(D-aspartate) O-methyltransferase